MADYVNPYAGMTHEELEAQFTKEDPRYPARKAASEALHKYEREWIENYEYDDGESGCHSPSEFEQMLIFDAMAGLSADEEYLRLHAAWKSLCGHGDPVAAAKALHGAALKTIEGLMRADPAKDSPAGIAFDALASAVEAYEQATLPPPFGSALVSGASAPAPAIQPIQAQSSDVDLLRRALTALDELAGDVNGFGCRDYPVESATIEALRTRLAPHVFGVPVKENDSTTSLLADAEKLCWALRPMVRMVPAGEQLCWVRFTVGVQEFTIGNEPMPEEEAAHCAGLFVLALAGAFRTLPSGAPETQKGLEP